MTDPPDPTPEFSPEEKAETAELRHAAYWSETATGVASAVSALSSPPRCPLCRKPKHLDREGCYRCRDCDCR